MTEAVSTEARERRVEWPSGWRDDLVGHANWREPVEKADVHAVSVTAVSVGQAEAVRSRDE